MDRRAPPPRSTRPLAEPRGGASIAEKVERSLLVDDLGPSVTATVLSAAISQFGRVESIEFCWEPLRPITAGRSALVEMSSPEAAGRVCTELTEKLFMVAGLPRPVRACRARPEMYNGGAAPAGGAVPAGAAAWLHDAADGAERGAALEEWKRLALRHAAERHQLEELAREEAQQLHARQEQLAREHYNRLQAARQLDPRDLEKLKTLLRGGSIPGREGDNRSWQ